MSFVTVKDAGGLAGLKISKSAILPLSRHNFSNTEPSYTKYPVEQKPWKIGHKIKFF